MGQSHHPVRSLTAHGLPPSRTRHRKPGFFKLQDVWGTFWQHPVLSHPPPAIQPCLLGAGREQR